MYCGFRALRDIQPGEELTWNYLTTEYDMQKERAVFDCRCGSENRVGEVKGFKYLSKEQQEALLPVVSTFLRTKFWLESLA